MSLEIYQLSKDNGIEVIGIDDEFKAGDLCWLETPLNPTGEARSVFVIEASYPSARSDSDDSEISSIMRIRSVVTQGSHIPLDSNLL